MYQDMDANSTGGGRLLMGMLLGVAVGAAIGLAFAPYTGQETRRRLGESGQKIRKSAQRGYERASTNVSQLIDRGREAVERGQQAYDRARNEVSETLGAS